MNHLDAEKIGREASRLFVESFEALTSFGYHEHARAMMMASFPYVLAITPPLRRYLLLADIMAVFSEVGDNVFEDSQDLYDFLTNRVEDME